MSPENLKKIAASTDQIAPRNALVNAADEITRLHAVIDDLRNALLAFDAAAKDSGSIIGFAGKALPLIKKARAALAKSGA